MCSDLRLKEKVKISPVAYFPGEVIHTNEFLVLLGENYFVKKTSSEGLQLIERRKKCKSIQLLINPLEITQTSKKSIE